MNGWELRWLAAHRLAEQDQFLYGIIHGYTIPRLRLASLHVLLKGGFDGLAIGGNVGRTRADLLGILSILKDEFPSPLPRHLLGIGDAPSIVDSIPFGIDTFDAAFPLRVARHGTLFRFHHSFDHAMNSCSSEQGMKALSFERVTILNARHRFSNAALDEHCPCSLCRSTTLSFLHHLHKSHEPSGLSLASSHNLAFMLQLMGRIHLLIQRDLL